MFSIPENNKPLKHGALRCMCVWCAVMCVCLCMQLASLGGVSTVLLIIRIEILDHTSPFSVIVLRIILYSLLPFCTLTKISSKASCGKLLPLLKCSNWKSLGQQCYLTLKRHTVFWMWGWLIDILHLMRRKDTWWVGVCIHMCKCMYQCAFHATCYWFS